jgi:hypothetical protein
MADAYRGDRGSQCTFRPLFHPPYDDRFFPLHHLDLNDWHRQKIACVTRQYQKRRLPTATDEINVIVVLKP